MEPAEAQKKKMFKTSLGIMAESSPEHQLDAQRPHGVIALCGSCSPPARFLAPMMAGCRATYRPRLALVLVVVTAVAVASVAVSRPCSWSNTARPPEGRIHST